jgi:hypothetical protein
MRLVRNSPTTQEIPCAISYSQFDSLLNRAALGAPDRELIELLPQLDSAQISEFLDTLDKELAAMFEQADLIGKKIEFLKLAAQNRHKG